MELVGQAVPDRNTGVMGQIFHDLLPIAAVLDAVKHPAQHPGGVGNGFLFADLAARRVKVGDLHAQIVSGNLKAAAGAGGGLFKDQGDVLACQLLIVADAGLFPGLQVSGQIEQLLDLGRGVVQKLQKTAIFSDSLYTFLSMQYKMYIYSIRWFYYITNKLYFQGKVLGEVSFPLQLQQFLPSAGGV